MNRSILVAAMGCVFALSACLETAPVEDETIAEAEDALSCAPVEYCPPVKPVAEMCEAEGRELTTGPCGCAACTKLEGEPCGGLWNLQGSCGSGLICQVPLSQSPQSKLVLVGQPGVCVPSYK